LPKTLMRGIISPYTLAGTQEFALRSSEKYPKSYLPFSLSMAVGQ
jgi:hypothetical protein